MSVLLSWRRRAMVRRLVRLAFAAMSAAVAACDGGAAPRGSRSSEQVDDFGDTLRTGGPQAVKRIVSLNPATTEILFAVGAGSRLVGRTRWDVHPDSARLVPDLGDGLQPNVEAVLGTHPDLVVLYASPDTRDAARQLRAAGVSTVALRVDRVAQFRRATLVLGRLVGDTARARSVVDSVGRTLDRVRRQTAQLSRPRVFWKAWDVPLLAIGGGSFMTELLDIAGARNIYADLSSPSPQVTLEDVIRRDPDLVLAGTNSASTFTTSPAWRGLRAVRERHIVLVDTNLVAFPAVRLGEAAVALARLLHPEALR